VEAIETVVIALEEARSLILKGKPAHLRIALIVLDNTVETLLWRSTKISLYEDHIRETADRQWPQEGKRPFRKKLPSKSDIYWMDRDFNLKARFLVKRGLIPSETAALLRHLHAYRNEVQHRDSLRVVSIRAVSIVFFEIACDLLLRLDLPGKCPQWGDQDWATKYEIDPFKRKEGDAAKVARVLKNGLAVGLPETASRLSEDLVFRLDWLVENLQQISKDSAEDSLKALQFWAADRSRALDDRGPSFTSFRPTCTMNSLKRWRDSSRELPGSTSSLSLVSTFARIDAGLGRIEDLIEDLFGHDVHPGGGDMRWDVDDSEMYSESDERDDSSSY